MENGEIINLMKFKISSIASDASFRSFFRIHINKKSKILVHAEKDQYTNLIAYTSINSFLRSKKILTPKIFSYNLKKNLIIIQDFGDLSFYKVLLRNKNKLVIYKKLVKLLLKIQKIRPKYKVKSILGKYHKVNKYSPKYLHEESDLFFDWYLPFFYKKNKIKNIKKKAKKNLSKLYRNLNFQNSHFVHRDFHVQNLIKVNKRIGVIDSQDALIGNAAYDLVSLIDDVRIKTSTTLKKQIYDYYLKKTLNIYKKNPKKFLEDFNTLSVQRSLKIIGIFARLYSRDKKKNYLKMIPYTWKLLEIRINHAAFSELKKILDINIPKKLRKKILA